MTKQMKNAPEGPLLPKRLMKILDAQGGKCALCDRAIKREANDKGYFPYVDHHHFDAPPKDRVRGILCGGCNRGLGLIGDGDKRTYRILKRLVEYLEVDRNHGSHAALVRPGWRARETYAEIDPLIRELHGNGATWAEIANELNGAGYRTHSGKVFRASHVRRLFSNGE